MAAMEDGCHGMLVHGPCIFKTKRHHNIIDVPNRDLECSFLGVLGSHSNLIVPTIPILEGEYGTSCS